MTIPSRLLNVTYRYPSNIDIPADVGRGRNATANANDVDIAYNGMRNLADSLSNITKKVNPNTVFTDAPTFSTPEEVNVVLAQANYNSVVVTLPATLAEFNARTIVYKALVVATGYTLTIELPVGADYFIDGVFTSVTLKAFQAITLKHLPDVAPFVIIESSHLFDLSTADPPISLLPEVRP